MLVQWGALWSWKLVSALKSVDSHLSMAKHLHIILQREGTLNAFRILLRVLYVPFMLMSLAIIQD